MSYCIDDQGATVDGYYYYPAQDIMVSSYCLETYDTCGTYQYTLDAMDLYYRNNGPDLSCVNLVSNTPTGS